MTDRRVGSPRREGCESAKPRHWLNNGYWYVRESRDRFTVYAPTGKAIGTSVNDYIAAAKADRHWRERNTRVRSCMCCEASFTSQGPHNRLCTNCRDYSGGLI